MQQNIKRNFCPMMLIFSMISFFASCKHTGDNGLVGRSRADSKKTPSSPVYGAPEGKGDPEAKFEVPSKDPTPTPSVTTTSSNQIEGKVAEKMQCEMFLYRNKHHGCGPSTIGSWVVWILPTVPKLKNDFPSDEVRETATLRGIYGDNRDDRCHPNNSNSGYASCCVEALKRPEYTPLPLTHDQGGFTYQFWTDGVPGSAECPAYTRSVSPLLISFTKDQMEVMSPAKGPFFDLDATGFISRYSWPADGSKHMFLVTDKNHDGTVSSGEELLGDSTTGPDGKKSDNGFLALKKYDTNLDGRISSEDSPFFGTLQLWGDENGNGISESTEMFSLSSKHIKSIDLNYKDNSVRLDAFGSEAKETSSVELDDGGSLPIIDYWFIEGPRR